MPANDAVIDVRDVFKVFVAQGDAQQRRDQTDPLAPEAAWHARQHP